MPKSGLTKERAPVQQDLKVPPEVLDLILDHLDDRSAKYNILVSCRDYYNVSIRHVYAHIVISTPKQVRTFIRTAKAATVKPHLAEYFRHTRSFSYCLSEGNPPPIRAHPKDSKMYLSLRGIQSHTSSPTAHLLMPNLERAVFQPLPLVGKDEMRLSRKSFEYQSNATFDDAQLSTFLSSVASVELLQGQHTQYDYPPSFYSLGLTNVQSLTLHSLCGALLGNSYTCIRDFVGYQGGLTQIVFDLEAYIARAMGCAPTAFTDMYAYSPPRVETGGHRNSIFERSRETDWYIFEFVNRLAYMVNDLAYRGAGGSDLLQSRCCFPSLKSLTIHVGPKGDSVYDDIGEGFRRELPGFSSPFRESEVGKLPDVILKQRGGRDWVFVSPNFHRGGLPKY